MSYFNFEFVSPEPLYALIKEELKSYFDTGQVDDVLFPKWTSKCLSKLGRSANKIRQTILYIEDFKAKLPSDFLSVREAKACLWFSGPCIQSPNSTYMEFVETTTKVGPTCEVSCNPCADCGPEVIRVVYKQNTSFSFYFQTTHYLTPGNVNARSKCSPESMNLVADSWDSFDVNGNIFSTNFREGVVHLTYYSEEYDNEGSELIPDNYRIQEYIEAFIKYKIFEMLCNQITDETYSQIERKKADYKQQADEAYIIADIEKKKQTFRQKLRSIRREKNSLNKYKLPITRYGWR